MIFYKETNIKETPVGRLPEDWKVLRLRDVAKVDTGGNAPQGEKYFKDGRYPFIRVQHLDGDEIYVDKWDLINDEAVNEYGLKLFPKNSIIFPKSGASINLEKRAMLPFDSYVVNHLCVLVPNHEVIDCRFLFYVMKKTNLSKNSAGTTLPYLNLEYISKVFVPFPPVSEQRAIAGVLGVVDSLIAKTDEVIVKTERLKKGLMQTLLTRGIGHKEFKETEIGKIPKTWQVVKLGEVILEAKSGFASGKRDENGILQLRMDSIETDGWINPEAGVRVPIPPDVEEYLLKPGDILFNNTNSVDLIGKTAIFRGELPKCVFSNHLTRIRVNPERVLPEWILYVLIRKWQTGVFKAICHRHVHQAGINNNDLLNIKIPLPEISEQQKITQILLTIDKKQKIEKQEKARVEKIKRCLMDLLLTGKIRVRVD